MLTSLVQAIYLQELDGGGSMYAVHRLPVEQQLVFYGGLFQETKHGLES